ncbi:MULTISPECIES: DUF2970 domain-containing protein [Nitrosomonas]|uniref:DUF2970 domain-containing protein n=1 Tax=Nitrosomonas TaxID=914 RepID=UPI000B7F2082|nr:MULTISPECIES: DUF2970 domain-containing protein [Nitrosomonas]MDV6340390.1 DUF2970 domain-containing protein [Nitrosomonas sp. Is24]MDV6346155.1 DUF2970 domain-containing protein [Nitrosomonas sp. Is35]
MNNVTDKQTSGTIWQVAKAVMFAFMGIRKKSDLEKDAATLKPVQLIIGGIIGGALFVISVMLLVRLVVS